MMAMKKKYNKRTERAMKVWGENVKDGGLGVSTPLAEWAGEKVVQRIAFASGRKAWCSYCGQSFVTEKTRGSEVCPHCGSRLKVEKTRAWSRTGVYFVQELDAWSEFQAVRTYLVDVYFRKGQKMVADVWHAYDWLIGEDGNAYCFSRRLKAFPAYRRIPFSLWDDGERPAMEFRRNADKSEWNSGWIIQGYYPRRRVQKWMGKFGIRGRFGGLDMSEVLRRLADGTIPHLETVWKERDFTLCRAFLYDGYRAERYWPQIKIARRRGFRFSDWKMWADHISMLEGEGYDICNPEYIAPENLAVSHRRLIAQRERRREREDQERERMRKMEEMARREELKDPDSPLNRAYRDRVGKVLAVFVRSGDIEIRPLQDVRDFFEEGKALHHCVYENRYYDLEGSLILGARVKGRRTETIELNLKTLEIEQCRGKYNQDSEWHESIRRLMERSVQKFRMARV